MPNLRPMRIPSFVIAFHLCFVIFSIGRAAKEAHTHPMSFIRIAVENDLPSIAAFDQWRMVSRQTIAAGECFVAGTGDAVEAYAIRTHWFHGRPFVSMLFVRPECRRTGLGDALLAHLESISTRDRIWISTNSDNVPMQRLLQKRGYESCGVIEKLDPIPELVFSKVIKPRTPLVV